MIKIYTKDSCGYCTQAKMFLQGKNLEYTEVRIGKHITRDEFLEQFPEARTVPYVTINDEVVGGYSQLVAYFA